MDLKKTVSLEIAGNKYEVGFPSTGEFMEIRRQKSIMNSDLYIVDQYDQYASLLGEMIATFNVMIPDLKKDLNTPTIAKLSMFESKELVDVYANVYKPFIDSWIAEVMKPKVKEESEA